MRAWRCSASPCRSTRPRCSTFHSPRWSCIASACAARGWRRTWRRWRASSPCGSRRRSSRHPPSAARCKARRSASSAPSAASPSVHSPSPCDPRTSPFAAAYGVRGGGGGGLIDRRLPARGDLANPANTPVRGTYVTAAARDALAKEVCAMHDSTITLHGELAYALATSLGLDYRLHCPASQDRFRIFGTDSGAHLAALPESIVPVLGIAQGKPAHGLRLLTSVRPIYPAEGKRFEQR